MSDDTERSQRDKLITRLMEDLEELEFATGLFDRRKVEDDELLEDAWIQEDTAKAEAATRVIDRKGDFLAPVAVRDIAGYSVVTPPVVFNVRNMPTEEMLERALEVRPEARPLLEVWRKIWLRTLGSAESVRRHGKHNESQEDGIEGRRAHCEDRAKRSIEIAWKITGSKQPAIDPDRENRRTLEASDNPGERYRVASIDLAQSRRLLTHPGERDWRLHILDDVAKTLAMCQARPHWAAIHHCNCFYVLAGFDEDGLPIFNGEKKSDLPEFERAHKVAELTGGSYWKSGGFQDLAGRKTYYGDSIYAPYVLRDMARAGCRKAFVKSQQTKGGTWVLDIDGLTDERECAAEFARQTWPQLNGPAIVQEFVPILQEHRFFVVNGRVACSTASHRDLCAIDARKDRILDERMATLKTPPEAAGEYDRGKTSVVVDRIAVARCALVAREMARRLRSENRLNYVVDVGIAADGRCLPIELNTITQAGPYAADYDRIVRAHNRGIDLYVAETEAKLARLKPRALERLAENEGARSHIDAAFDSVVRHILQIRRKAGRVIPPVLSSSLGKSDEVGVVGLIALESINLHRAEGETPPIAAEPADADA